MEPVWIIGIKRLLIFIVVTAVICCLIGTAWGLIESSKEAVMKTMTRINSIGTEEASAKEEMRGVFILSLVVLLLVMGVMAIKVISGWGNGGNGNEHYPIIVQEDREHR